MPDVAGMVFCNTCYKRLFGPRGCGYGNSLVSAAGLADDEHGQSRTETPTHRPGSGTPSLMPSLAPKLQH